MAFESIKNKYKSYRENTEKRKAQRLEKIALETKRLRAKQKTSEANKKIKDDYKKAKKKEFDNSFAGGLWNSFKKEVKTRRSKNRGLFADEARELNKFNKRKKKGDSGLFSDSYDWNKLK